MKQCIRNLCPNISEAAVSKLCKAESSTRLMLEKLDKTLNQFSKSGSHSETSENKDLDELIKKVAVFKPFSELEGPQLCPFLRL